MRPEAPDWRPTHGDHDELLVPDRRRTVLSAQPGQNRRAIVQPGRPGGFRPAIPPPPKLPADAAELLGLALAHDTIAAPDVAELDAAADTLLRGSFLFDTHPAEDDDDLPVTIQGPSASELLAGASGLFAAIAAEDSATVPAWTDEDTKASLARTAAACEDPLYADREYLASILERVPRLYADRERELLATNNRSLEEARDARRREADLRVEVEVWKTRALAWAARFRRIDPAWDRSGPCLSGFLPHAPTEGELRR